MSDIGTMQMSYEGLVEAGREARQQADDMQWIEGDLALQVEALEGNERPRDPETGDFVKDEVKTLQRYALDLDVPYPTLREYRRTSLAWPVDARRRAPWAVHKVLASQDDRSELIRDEMTYREASKLVRDRNAAGSGKPGWFELLGIAADLLSKADKQLAKAEDVIDDPSPDLRAKALQYAGLADDLAARLRSIAGAA